MPYPSVVATLTNPLATQKLNSPSHSTIETNQNTEVIALETFIGTLSSAVGTIMYDVRAAASGGGGHVQAANVGGTGQTSYNKGDILAAASSSVLNKFAVGTDNYVLTADSTQTNGLNWTAVATAANIQNQTNTYAIASVLSASVYGITFPTAVASSVQGQAFVVKFPTTNTTSVLALQVSSLAANRIKNVDLTNPIVGAIQASMIGILEYDGAGNFQIMNTYVPTYGTSQVQYLRNDGVFASIVAANATTTGLVPTPPNNTNTFLRGDATFASVLAVTTVTGTAPIVSSGGATPAISINNATATAAGAVPTPPNNTTTFFRGDATFNTPPSANATTAGYVPTPPNNTTTWLRGDATFTAVTDPRSFKNGTTTKDSSDAATTQNIAHGLGATPKYIRLTCSAGGAGAGSGATFYSQTVYNGTTQSSQSHYYNSTNTPTSATDNTFTLNASAAGNGVGNVGAVTWNGTNIIITWTTPVGAGAGIYQILWEAEG